MLAPSLDDSGHAEQDTRQRPVMSMCGCTFDTQTCDTIRGCCDSAGMRRARAAAIATGILVVGMLVWLTVAQWELANRVATIASAVGTVAAAGIAIWAVWRTATPSRGPMSAA